MSTIVDFFLKYVLNSWTVEMRKIASKAEAF